MGSPPDVVLPCEEEVTCGTDVVLVRLPDPPAYVNNRCGSAGSFQRLDDPDFQAFFWSHLPRPNQLGCSSMTPKL